MEGSQPGAGGAQLDLFGAARAARPAPAPVREAPPPSPPPSPAAARRCAFCGGPVAAGVVDDRPDHPAHLVWHRRCHARDHVPLYPALGARIAVVRHRRGADLVQERGEECRVAHCSNPPAEAAACTWHDTPRIREMRRPAAYSYPGPTTLPRDPDGRVVQETARKQLARGATSWE